jgi:TonB family protein
MSRLPRLFCSILGALALLGASRPAGYERPKVHRTVEPQFPPKLLENPRINEGEATVVLLVDASGLIADSLVTRYTHPLFGKEALETVHQWRFEPGRLHGAPVGVRMEMVFTFARGRRVVNVVDPEAVSEHLLGRVEGLLQAEVRRVCPARELDEPIQVVDFVQPLPPEQLGARRRSGRALVEFYVDEEGRPRLPVVVESDDEAFGRSALEAIGQWRFTVPRSGGWPVLVVARQRFDFRASASGPTATGAAPAAGPETPR